VSAASVADCNIYLLILVHGHAHSWASLSGNKTVKTTIPAVCTATQFTDSALLAIIVHCRHCLQCTIIANSALRKPGVPANGQTNLQTEAMVAQNCQPSSKGRAHRTHTAIILHCLGSYLHPLGGGLIPPLTFVRHPLLYLLIALQYLTGGVECYFYFTVHTCGSYSSTLILHSLCIIIHDRNVLLNGFSVE